MDQTKKAGSTKGVIKFSDLDQDYQNSFLLTEEEIAQKGFIFSPNPESKSGVLFLAIFISVGTTVMLFIANIIPLKQDDVKCRILH